VEDEPLVMDLVTNVLIRNRFEVIAAIDGDEAGKLFHAHAHKLCLVVVNIALPKTSGLEFIDELPTRDPRVPVIFITGLGEQQTLVKQALDEGYAVLQKPFTAETLLEFMLTAMADQRDAAAEDKLCS
jgi:DNA-binding NtrC family response regulator